MQTMCAAKELKTNFQLRQQPSGILGLGYLYVIVRTDGESSIVALSRRVGENTQRSRCQNKAHNTSPAYDSRSAGHAESGVRIVKEKVRTLICFARELHGVTVGKSHVSLPWCVRFAAQIISRSHRGTDGMTGYRRAYGRSRMPSRYVPRSEKVFYLEQSKRKVQVEAKWHEGIFIGIKDESEIAVVGTPHGIVFSRSIRRVPKKDSGDGMLLNSIRGAPWELQPGAEGGVVNRVQLDVQVAIPERQAPPPTVGEQLPRRVYIRRSVEVARYGYTNRCIGCQHAILALKPADHNEECRARIVRHMTADDNLNQRVQIAQDRTIEATLSEARAGERDSSPEPDSRSALKNKHLMVLSLQIHGVPAAVRAAVPVLIPAAVQPRLPHRCRSTKAFNTAQQDRKLLIVLTWNWKGWLGNQSGIDFNDTLTVISWCKSSRTLMFTLTEFFPMITGRKKL